MFKKTSPESEGLSSANIVKFINTIEKRHAIMHSLLIMRHGKIITENYWAPFNKDFCHRMYSETKSYMSIAIGLLEEEGKLSLSDKIVDHFPKYKGIHEYLDAQTIKDMLKMTTVGNPIGWFSETDNPSRVDIYFKERKICHPFGTVWEYDGNGSQVLAELVEKLSGTTLLDYLKKKLFNKMGTFKTAEILRVRDGAVWGDSALLCTTRDMASFAQLLLNGGSWNGEQLINERFVKEATAKQSDNRDSWRKCCYTHGYGYQIWRTEQNGFAFLGMGDQLTICLPDRDLLFVCTADNQGTDDRVKTSLFNAFFDIIVDNLSDTPLAEDKEAEKLLAERTADLKLYCETGIADTAFRRELDGTEYECAENPMGIKDFFFSFSEDGSEGVLHYTNAQGKKEIPFGVNHNVFGKFPELGYSNDFGGLRTTDGFMYKDAVSAAWLEEKKIIVTCQIIDRYFGIMSAVFAFNGDLAAAQFAKVGEDFLNEYSGELSAWKKK